MGKLCISLHNNIAIIWLYWRVLKRRFFGIKSFCHLRDSILILTLSPWKEEHHKSIFEEESKCSVFWSVMFSMCTVGILFLVHNPCKGFSNWPSYTQRRKTFSFINWSQDADFEVTHLRSPHLKCETFFYGIVYVENYMSSRASKYTVRGYKMSQIWYSVVCSKGVDIWHKCDGPMRHGIVNYSCKYELQT